MADWPYSTMQWQRLRQRKLVDKPLCEACELRGQVTVANTVDHVLAISQGGEPFPPLAGLMALCASCHGEKTRAIDVAGGKGVRFKGAAIDGTPIDPLHPFFADGSGGIPPSRTGAIATRTDVKENKILSSPSKTDLREG